MINFVRDPAARVTELAFPVPDRVFSEEAILSHKGFTMLTTRGGHQIPVTRHSALRPSSLAPRRAGNTYPGIWALHVSLQPWQRGGHRCVTKLCRISTTTTGMLVVNLNHPNLIREPTLGLILKTLHQLASFTASSVLAYEYNGYSLAEGTSDLYYPRTSSA